MDVITVGKNSVNMKLLLKKFFDKKIQTILVEGGGTINWEFIKNLFDELIHYGYLHFIIGGSDNLYHLQKDIGFPKVSNSPNLISKIYTKTQKSSCFTLYQGVSYYT